MQDSRPPEPAPPFEDRGVRLRLFGSLAILAGCALVLLGLLHLLPLLGAGGMPAAETGLADGRTYAMGALLYALLGGAFVWIGAGSVRMRRWARPLMLTLAWTWLLGGVCVLFLLPGLLDLALGVSLPGAPALDPAVAGLVKLVLMIGTAVFGVAVPALFVWAYHDRGVRLTCEAHDPRPDWTERCPPAVLGLSLGLGACGILALLTALRPVVPLFGALLTGAPAVASLLAGAGLCLWLARETYALRVRGWWVATAFLVLIGVSTWLTLWRAEPAELFRAMGYPEDWLGSGDARFGTVATWLTAVLTVLTVVFMVRIRKHFGERHRGGQT
jgi:hypothetical protein